MPDLHGWITQQIDETERLARRAAELCGCHPPAPSWSFRDGDEPTDGRILVVGDPHPSLKRKIGRRWNGSYEGLSMAEHVVRHDPASVLRRCAADRKILAEHKPCGGKWEPYACEGCGMDGGDCADWMVDHVNDCPTLLALAEGYGLTEERRAALDRPEKERPTPTGPSLFSNEIMNAYSKALTEMVLNTRPVEPRLIVKLVGPAPAPMPDWLREDLGLPDPAPEPTPEQEAMEILAPELKKIPGYVPTTEEQP